MYKASLLLVVGLALTTALPACIFQNDPVRPNSPPRITYAAPEGRHLEVDLGSGITFVLEASDADLDELSIEYVLLGGNGRTDSLLHTGGTFTFVPPHGGQYDVQGRVRDRFEVALRDWRVTVIEKRNDPPRINWRSPAQDSLTVLIGATVEFSFNDTRYPDPGLLRYSYLVGGVLVRDRQTTPGLAYRFMQNGIIDVTGVIWASGTQHSDTTSWTLTVVGEPDTIPPAPIVDLVGWTGPDPGTVTLQWTAPGDDGHEGTASYYEIRTQTIAIQRESDWSEASPKHGAPVPGPAGTVQTALVPNLNEGTWLYVTVRAVDDFGNMSALGNCIRLLARGFDADGRIIDAETGEPLAGIFVSAAGIVDTTGADGRYLLANLPYYAERIHVRDELITGFLGDYYDLSWVIPRPTWHFTLDLPLVPVLGLGALKDSQDYYSNGDFLEFLKYLTRPVVGSSPIFRRWHHYPVSVFNPPFTWVAQDTLEVDLQAAAATAMASWESGTGFDLFVETDDPQAADVVIRYDVETDNRNHTVNMLETNPDGTPRKMEIVIYPRRSTMPVHRFGLKIFAHELGHILQLGHSVDSGHLMYGWGTPTPDEPTIDELRLIRVLHRFPVIFNKNYIVSE